MRRLLLLVDDRSYIRSNCYQHQLAATLARCYRVRMMSAREVRFALLVRLAAYDRVLSVLRLRTLVRLAGSLARVLGDRALYVYEQDVWQAFIDDSPYKGAYRQLAAQLNIAAFLVTSRWWRDFVVAGGLPAKFVRMGMLPEYCDAGPAWEDRPIRLGFQGTLHPHRRALYAYAQLAQMGLEVETLPPEAVAEIVAWIEAMNPRQRRDRMVASAETMRRRDDWMTVVRAIEA